MSARSVSSAKRGLRLSIAGAVVLGAIAMVVATASATAPTRNGSIAFRRYFNDQHSMGAVFTIRVNGTLTRQVTHPPKGIVDEGSDWAPDGSLIAFMRCPPNQLCHDYVVRPDGSGLAPVGPLCPRGAHEDTCPDEGGRKLHARLQAGDVHPVDRSD